MRERMLGAAEAFTRKAGTLCSMCRSSLLMTRDGQDPRHFYHAERLRYLELRSALNWKENLVVYDIGASVGSFAAFVARLRSVAAVYCFEPIPAVFEQLVQNSRSQPKVQCFRLALGDSTEHRLFHVNEFSPSSSLLPLQAAHEKEFPHARITRSEEVQVLTLSQAARELSLLPPDFIKVDVQGFEDHVVRGGEDVFRRSRFCMLELSLTSLYENSALIVEMTELMSTLGFKLIGILDRKVVGQSRRILQLDGIFENEQILG